MFVELSFLIKVLASNSSKDEIHRDQWKKLRFDEQGLENLWNLLHGVSLKRLIIVAIGLIEIRHCATDSGRCMIMF